MLTFAAALFFLIITPGPGVLTTAGIGAGFGWPAGLRFLVGLGVGTNLVSLAVVSGLAAVVLSVPSLRVVLMAASAGYLLYLAARIAFAGTRVAFMEADSSPGVLGGLMLQLINPKAYAVSTALFSGFAFMPDDLLTETLIKFLIMNLVWIPVHLVWLWAGVSLHRLDPRPSVQSAINKAMALAMLVVVALAVRAQI